jgi:mannose-6-phosphate isomerase
MFVGITNTPRNYAWGSTDAIAGLLGRQPSGEPEAELWLGTHPGSPARIVDPAAADGDVTLDQLVTLPYLLKVLAAASPLSLQAHPNLAQAAAGFARENAAGVPLDAPFRNYKDALHKPELIYALSPTFDALCGFRAVAETRVLLQTLGGLGGSSAGSGGAGGSGGSGDSGGSSDPLVGALLDRLADDSSLRSVFEWLISRGDGVDELVGRVVELAAAAGPAGEFSLELATVGVLAEAYPGDPGIVISLLLNRVRLAPGEALYLPAGNIHAYLDGLGIELMAASDNVLRGGLTPKHIDVPELLAVLDFEPLPAPYLVPSHPSPDVTLFRPPVPDFELVVIVVTENEGVAAEYAPETGSLALCTAGLLRIRGAHGEFELRRGDAVYISADEAPLTFSGAGTAFLATSHLG